MIFMVRLPAGARTAGGGGRPVLHCAASAPFPPSVPALYPAAAPPAHTPPPHPPFPSCASAYEPNIDSKGVPEEILVSVMETFRNGTYSPPLPVKMLMLGE